MSGIQIENLVKTYGDNIAVNGLNLNLEKGKVYEHEKEVIYCCTYLGSSCAANLYYEAD